MSGHPGASAGAGTSAFTGIHFRAFVPDFRNKFGVTPVDFRNAIRLERFRVLLKNPSLTVAEAANQTGFADPACFTRLLRKRHGRLPTSMR